MHPKARRIQIFAIAVIAIIMLNLLLFAFHQINSLMFWVVIAVCALAAYKVLPWLKNK